MRALASYAAGLIFGFGIIISGMVNPAKVINFFDVFGTWDPSLAFVMGGALVVTIIGYKIVLGTAAPLFDDRFHLPGSNQIDTRLISGAAIFGVGWGLSGFCPGGSIPAVGTFRPDVLVFVAALVAGIVGTRLFLRSRSGRSDGSRSPERAASSSA